MFNLMRTPSTMFIKPLLLFCLFVPFVASMQRDVCNRQVQDMLTNGTISRDDWIFHREGGIPMSDPMNIELTIDGCRATCGAKFDWYSDIGPRLTTWLVPVLLLIGNMFFARLGSDKSAFVILHLLGDPIDSMWSLLTKAETWSRCHSLAQKHMPGAEEYHVRDRATILAAIEELDGPLSDPYERFQSITSDSKLPPDVLDHLCNETASELADSRTDLIVRAGLAVFSYLYAVVAGFVDAVGGKSSSQPGGRIGTAMFISWLVPAVLLSNSIGGFTSRRTCLRILERFAKTVADAGHMDMQLFSKQRRSSKFRRLESTTETDFHSAQVWSGAAYTYRPEKHIFSGGQKDRSVYALSVLAFLPVAYATTFAFLVIWYTPTTGLTCRHMYIIGIFVAWVLSAVLTHLTWRLHIFRGKYHWYFVLIKDAIIGIPSIAIEILSSSGIFNSCYCWSAVFSRGLANGVVILDPENARRHNGKTWYPGFVGACLGLQLLTFVVMLFVSRHGAILFRRNEDVRQEDFDRTHKAREKGVMSLLAVSTTAGSLGFSADSQRDSAQQRLLY